MATARKRLVDTSVTPYYHCMVRCVRRAFLCGKDPLTKKSFEHRRGWIQEKLKLLGKVFAMDICAYAVMSNHYHVVLHVDTKRGTAWSFNEVIERWYKIFKGNEVVDKYRKGEILTEAEQAQVNKYVKEWRENLSSISWFMRCMNEKIARQANLEDECTGRFWEGRFKSQALLDVEALISCMAYVDLNPIRAGITDNLDGSDYTSVQERLLAVVKAKKMSISNIEEAQPSSLASFSATESLTEVPIIPMPLSSYLLLVQATGKFIRSDKSGYISEDVIPILQKLGINPYGFIEVVKNHSHYFKTVSGSISQLFKFNEHFNKQWSKGITGSRLLYRDVA